MNDSSDFNRPMRPSLCLHLVHSHSTAVRHTCRDKMLKREIDFYYLNDDLVIIMSIVRERKRAPAGVTCCSADLDGLSHQSKSSHGLSNSAPFCLILGKNCLIKIELNEPSPSHTFGRIIHRHPIRRRPVANCSTE